MRKYFLICLALTSFQISFSQEDYVKRKRHEIDSLKNVLQLLRDNERVDCLNSLVQAYLSYGELQARIDSSASYAIAAVNEAATLAYKVGIVKALLNLGEFQKVKVNINRKAGKFNNDDLIKTWEGYTRKAISAAMETQNDELIGDGFYMLSGIQGRKKEFADQIASHETSIAHYRKAGNEKKEAEINTWLCLSYSGRGDFEKGLLYCQRSLQLARKNTASTADDEWQNYVMQQSFVNMANLYKVAGDYDQAFAYIHKSRQFAIEKKTGWDMQSELGELYTRIGKFDSAFIFLKDFTKNNPDQMWGNMLLGETYIAVKDYDNALKLLQSFIDATKKKNSTHPDIIRALLDAGRAYEGKKNYKEAALNAQEGFELAYKLDAKPYMMDGYKLLSTIYYQLGKHDKAYQYLLKHTELKDSIINRQFLWRLNNYKKETEEERRTSQINLLNKDNQLKEQKLKQQAFVKNSLIIGILLLFLLGVFIFRNLSLKRKNDKLRLQKDLEMQQMASEKKHAELQQQALELEMQALRAQMNPHFIFNCLSSINRFIFKNDNKLASDYLTRFSRLIRMVLIHSSKKLITLEDELEMLRLYLDLERLRFKDAFDYSITTTNIVDGGAIFIPPLLLQPFCENAVWHGLMHKESKGHLNIIISEVISENEKVLHCVIEDDGVGREKAAEMKSKSAESEKSLGLKITTERLALLNQENNFSTFYKIEDVLNENGEVGGTRVQLKIRHKESIEELV